MPSQNHIPKTRDDMSAQCTALHACSSTQRCVQRPSESLQLARLLRTSYVRHFIKEFKVDMVQQSGTKLEMRSGSSPCTAAILFAVHSRLLPHDTYVVRSIKYLLEFRGLGAIWRQRNLGSPNFGPHSANIGLCSPKFLGH